MKPYEALLGLHRLQATVRSDNPEAIRWAEACGFEQEGIMARFGRDKMDYTMMGRLP